MIKKTIIVLISIQFVSCVELQKIASQLPTEEVISSADIGKGLKEALDNGIKNQVSKLTKTDGFYKNSLVKIMLPKELQTIDDGLRKIGLNSLADKGLLMLNRAAEDAVKTSTPIFVDAVKSITFSDAKNILFGDANAATQYLQGKTNTQLYGKFSPVIKNSFDKVGAAKTWKEIIDTYNLIPFVDKVNPDLTDYVTNQALKGVYTMIEIEEKGIRDKLSFRTSDLLKKVFGLQDK